MKLDYIVDNLMCSRPFVFVLSVFLFVIGQILLSISLGTMMSVLPEIGSICGGNIDPVTGKPSLFARTK